MSGENIWNSDRVVRTFRTARPSESLMRFAESYASRKDGPCRELEILDIGCGAGRNALPLAAAGHRVTGIDSAREMVRAARDAARLSRDGGQRCRFVEGSMDTLPFEDKTFDFLVAHGIWNLASSETLFRKAVSEAARVAREGAPLFLTTFSRNTIHPAASALAGTSFVFDDFNGKPQCFLTVAQIDEELGICGFRRGDEEVRELNRPAAWEQVGGTGLRVAGPRRPVLFEGVWYRQS